MHLVPLRLVSKWAWEGRPFAAMAANIAHTKWPSAKVQCENQMTYAIPRSQEVGWPKGARKMCIRHPSFVNSRFLWGSLLPGLCHFFIAMRVLCFA